MINRLNSRKKANRGIAVAYTVVTILAVLALCSLITAIMLSKSYTAKAYKTSCLYENLYAQIGEVFVASQDNTLDSLANNFQKNLELAEFDIRPAQNSNQHWILSYDGSDLNIFIGQSNETSYRLSISDNKRTLLSITVENGKVTEWTNN